MFFQKGVSLFAKGESLSTESLIPSPLIRFHRFPSPPVNIIPSLSLPLEPALPTAGRRGQSEGLLKLSLNLIRVKLNPTPVI